MALKKQGGGGIPSRRVGADSPVAWLQADTKWGSPGPNPREVGVGHRERHFRESKCLFSLQDSLSQPCPKL